MTNPIVDPLVEVPDTDTTSGLVLIEATPSGAVTVSLNRPERRNAFNAELIAALAEAFETLHAQDGVRVVFLEGVGGTFSAGADLDWMAAAAQHTEQDNREDAFQMSRMLKALHDIPAATVALVDGGAFGGGAGLACACDLAVATAEAKFSFSEVRLGLVAATISPYVIKAIGPRHARALFITGKIFDAAFAEKIGLATEVVADAAALAETKTRIARDILACGPEAVKASKALVDDFAFQAIDHGVMEDSAKRIAHARVSDEGREGVAAFLGKRRPEWSQA